MLGLVGALWGVLKLLGFFGVSWACFGLLGFLGSVGFLGMGLVPEQGP